VRILGIDPGLAAVGYALLWVGDTPADVELVEYDTFETAMGKPERERLADLRRWLSVYLADRCPDVVAVERPFPMPKLSYNIVPVSAAYGVLVEAAASVRVFRDYGPQVVKAAVGVKQREPKKLIRKAVQERFGARLRGRDDGLDAIAVALAYVRDLERESDYAASVRGSMA